MTVGFATEMGPPAGQCRRCGSCCLKGGPALHCQDLSLVRDGHLPFSALITIRQGEPVVSPLTNAVEPARCELIKIAGHGEDWACRFYDQQINACAIYDHRPLECRLLTCWAPEALLDIVYRDCLSRRQVLAANGELEELIGLQETHCAYGRLEELAGRGTGTLEGEEEGTLAELSRLVTLDLRIRQRAVQRLGLGLADELLAFGRPMFKSLPFYGLGFRETAQGLQVERRKP